MVKARPPSAVMRMTVCSAAVWLTSATATWAPSRPHRMLMARPLPVGSVAASKMRWPPPTIRMRRPFSRPLPGALPSDSADSGRTKRSGLASGVSAISRAPLLATVEHGHAGSRIEIGLGGFCQPRHHHVAADGDDGFDDLLVAEVLAHAREHGLADANILDHLAAEGEQRALGLAEDSSGILA